MRNSSVVPVELNRGFTATIISISGSCHPSDFTTVPAPRSHTPHASAAVSESASSKGCGAAMASAKATAK